MKKENESKFLGPDPKKDDEPSLLVCLLFGKDMPKDYNKRPDTYDPCDPADPRNFDFFYGDDDDFGKNDY